MSKFTKLERESLEMARLIACGEMKFAGMVYIGSPRKGRFYIPISRYVIEQRAGELWGEKTTPQRLNRVVSILRRACRLKGLDEDLGKLSLKRRREFDELMSPEE